MCNHLTNNSGLEVGEYSPGYVLAVGSLTEERVKLVVLGTRGVVIGHLTIRLDAVLQAVQLPAGIADLNPALTYVN